MLKRLTIQSFALIDHVELELSKGLTVFLGETGAGKSIVIDALAIALGERASAEIVRKGHKKAIIEATFSDVSEQLRDVLVVNDLVWDNPDVVIRREVSSTGTSRCFVNDTPAQLPIVRELSAFLIDFHGQHDTHGLLAARSHRDILDKFAGTYGELRLEMKSAYERMRTCEDDLQNIRKRAQDADADRVRLNFLHDEIASVDPQPNEDIRVSEELRRAESQEHVLAAAMRARDALYAADRSAYDLLREAKELIGELSAYDSRLVSASSDIESALIICKEIAGAVAPLADPDSASPERIEELRHRLSQLQRLIRKYGSLQAAIEQVERVGQELSILENLEEAISSREEQLGKLRAHAEHIAGKLHEQRSASAAALSGDIQASLQEMGMPSTTFSVELSPAPLGHTGTDSIEFLFSSNPGEPLRQLSKVASGGELSRVMLSIKRSLSAASSYGTMVFDEIDTGISGRIARIVGDVMKQISTSQQIICITHLPQIASLADAFVRIVKNSEAETTLVEAHMISSDEALIEVAKLLSGDDVSDISLSGARELMTKRRATSK
ncbi:MAG: DNA repair protein RecN [Ignavibacteria bacterium]|jgi:DNA repair protein RecN (Recombination protein N)